MVGRYRVTVAAEDVCTRYPRFNQSVELILPAERNHYLSEERLRSLCGVHAVVLVLDGQVERHLANAESLDMLELALAYHGYCLTHPRTSKSRFPPEYWSDVEVPPVFLEAVDRARRILVDHVDQVERRIPLVLQFNKIDLPNTARKDDMIRSLEFQGEAPPTFDTCATKGEGVMDAFDTLMATVEPQ